MRKKSNWKYKDGIPKISDFEIEEYATGFLEKYKPESLNELLPIPVFEILQKMEKEGIIKYKIEQLGYDAEYKILGKTILSENTIVIDKDLFYTSEKNFILRRTIAHEIGHWIFHRHSKIIFKDKDNKQNDINDFQYQYSDERGFKFLIGGIDPTQYRKNRLETSIDWAEHQAKVFAACVLMPNKLLHKAIINIQKELGIVKNIGNIYVTDERSNLKDFYITLDKLKTILDVSKKSIEFRLLKLGILFDLRKKPIYLQESIISYASNF